MSPSIFVPGQVRRKNVASAHEVICEQCVRPSQRNEAAGGLGVRVRAVASEAVVIALDPEEANCV